MASSGTPRPTDVKWLFPAVGRCSVMKRGNPVAVLETNNDISERKRREDEIRSLVGGVLPRAGVRPSRTTTEI